MACWRQFQRSNSVRRLYGRHAGRPGDLVAPLGTIDAGEAGIRVLGNVNLAALQVVNAANIQVQGTSTGVPTVQGRPLVR
ncbi:filamentous hemagglutinin family protein [Bradyrhizobium sp. CER78]|nr:filamentous haemagglutinin family protein [Bradyrhizobium sp. CER78]MDH2384898.1 filamentous hemagglutinin family protein [Bradyrhizobium sp. CER78]